MSRSITKPSLWTAVYGLYLCVMLSPWLGEMSSFWGDEVSINLVPATLASDGVLKHSPHLELSKVNPNLLALITQ